MKKMYCVALLAGMLVYACGGQKQLVQKNQEDIEVIVPWFRSGIYARCRAFPRFCHGAQ